MHDYTELAFAGEHDKVRAVLDPIRHALKSTRPGGKPQAHQNYWQELLGQVGGPVRAPMLQLTDEKRERTGTAFAVCGLHLLED